MVFLTTKFLLLQASNIKCCMLQCLIKYHCTSAWLLLRDYMKTFFSKTILFLRASFQSYFYVAFYFPMKIASITYLASIIQIVFPNLLITLYPICLKTFYSRNTCICLKAIIYLTLSTSDEICFELKFCFSLEMLLCSCIYDIFCFYIKCSPFYITFSVSICDRNIRVRGAGEIAQTDFPL